MTFPISRVDDSNLPVDSDVNVDVVLLEGGHVLHSLDDHVAGRTQPDRVDGGLIVHVHQGGLQLVEAISEVLADEIVNLEYKNKCKDSQNYY